MNLLLTISVLRSLPGDNRNINLMTTVNKKDKIIFPLARRVNSVNCLNVIQNAFEKFDCNYNYQLDMGMVKIEILC